MQMSVIFSNIWNMHVWFRTGKALNYRSCSQVLSLEVSCASNRHANGKSLLNHSYYLSITESLMLNLLIYNTYTFFCSSIQLRYIARGRQGKYPYEKFLVRPGIDPVIVSWITIQLWLWSPYYYYNYLYILLNYDSKSLFDPNHKYFYLNLKCTVCIQMQKWVNG